MSSIMGTKYRDARDAFQHSHDEQWENRKRGLIGSFPFLMYAYISKYLPNEGGLSMGVGSVCLE